MASLHSGHPELVLRVPDSPPGLLRDHVFSVRFRGGDRLRARPVGHRNPWATHRARSLHAQKAGLLLIHQTAA